MRTDPVSKDGWFGEFGGRYVPEALIAALRREAQVREGLSVGLIRKNEKASILVTLADGSQFGFEKLLLATGGRPRRLP